MPCILTNRAGPYLELRISGVMTVADMRQVQDLATSIECFPPGQLEQARAWARG
jgi:hypothetical protein